LIRAVIADRAVIAPSLLRLVLECAWTAFFRHHVSCALRKVARLCRDHIDGASRAIEAFLAFAIAFWRCTTFGAESASDARLRCLLIRLVHERSVDAGKAVAALITEVWLIQLLNSRVRLVSHSGQVAEAACRTQLGRGHACFHLAYPAWLTLDRDLHL